MGHTAHYTGSHTQILTGWADQQTADGIQKMLATRLGGFMPVA